MTGREPSARPPGPQNSRGTEHLQVLTLLFDSEELGDFLVAVGVNDFRIFGVPLLPWRFQSCC